MGSLSLQVATRDLSLGTATVNTLNALYPSAGPETSSLLPTFIPSATTLVGAGVAPPDGESLVFLRQLTSGAQATALSNFYDSVLVGPFSEASNGEFIDVGVWLGSGQYHKGREKAVLSSLGLGEWTQSTETRITTRRFKVPAECNAELLLAYQNLKDAHCFCVSSSGVATACFLLGEIDQGWCGLVSIAISPD